MRASLPGIGLLPATILLCLGWSAVGAAAGVPGVCQMWGGCEYGSQDPYGVPWPYMAPADSCDVPYDCGCDCGPRWTFTAEGITMQRSTAKSQPLFIHNPPTPLAESLYGDDLHFPLAFGMQLSAIRHDVCGSGLGVEVGYFQIDGFTAQAAVPGSSFMVTDLEGTGFTVNDGEACYTSAIYSGELNVRWPYTDWLTLLAGFRMGQLHEHYRGSGTDFVTLQPDLLAIDTHNYLYGFQLGAEAEGYNMGGPLVISARCKAGVFDNVAHQDYNRVYSGTPFNSFQSARDQVAFLGEAGVVATYALTKHLAFRASAEAMWLTSVALAPEQIGSVNLRSGNAIANTSGTLFYYGGGMGIECRF